MWSDYKLGHMFLDEIVTYGRLEWDKTLGLNDKTLDVKKEYFANLNRKWCSHFTLCVRDNHNVQWSYQLFKLVNLID